MKVFDDNDSSTIFCHQGHIYYINKDTFDDVSCHMTKNVQDVTSFDASKVRWQHSLTHLVGVVVVVVV